MPNLPDTTTLPAEGVLPHEPVTEAVTSSKILTISTGPTSAGWVSTNLRNIVAIALTILVCYLAYSGVEQARTALVNGFMLLIGAIWGERAALKQPGRDA